MLRPCLLLDFLALWLKRYLAIELVVGTTMGDISAELTLRLARFIQMPETPPASPARWFFVPEFHSAPWDEACSLLAAAPKPLMHPRRTARA